MHSKAHEKQVLQRKLLNLLNKSQLIAMAHLMGIDNPEYPNREYLERKILHKWLFNSADASKAERHMRVCIDSIFNKLNEQ